MTPEGTTNTVFSVIGGVNAVVIRNAYKSYSIKSPILNEFNMTVPSGSIYGLLGSSGCGKSTVLMCLLGQRKLDKGTILLYGQKLGSPSIGIPGSNVGYMPQETSLCMEFTIGEMLAYFANLGCLTKEASIDKRKLLCRLLNLPDQTKRINMLSGGEQRRVSLASAMINSPPLLILDEPTVGLDPELRHDIWTYLLKLVGRNKTTIIMTTHYYEECRMTNRIGIIRNGRLVAEGEPNLLLDEFQVSNLESIVLKLSSKEGKPETELFKKTSMKDPVQAVSWRKRFADDDEAETAATLNFRTTNTGHSWARIRALTFKNFVTLGRNSLLLFFQVFVTGFMLFLICFSLGGDPHNLKLAVVNEEVNDDYNCSNMTTENGICDLELLSCKFLEHISSDVIITVNVENQHDAIATVNQGDAWGYISFPKDFSSRLYERLASGSSVDEDFFAASQTTVRLDESFTLISLAIKKTLYTAYEDFTTGLLTNCGFDPRQAQSVIQYGKPLFGTDNTDFREFLAAGVTPSSLFFFPILSTSIRLIQEKKTGVITRSLVAGVKAWEILVANSISEFFVIVSQSMLAYGVLRIVFGIQIIGSDLLVIAILILSGCGGATMGILLGSICSQEITAALIGMATFLPNLLISGVLWPVEGMEPTMQPLVSVLPCALAGEAVRSITSRGWEFLHPKVYPGILVTLYYILGFTVITVLYHIKVKN